MNYDQFKNKIQFYIVKFAEKKLCKLRICESKSTKSIYLTLNHPYKNKHNKYTHTLRLRISDHPKYPYRNGGNKVDIGFWNSYRKKGKVLKPKCQELEDVKLLLEKWFKNPWKFNVNERSQK